MEQTGEQWWIYTWLVISGFSLFMMWIYPTWIAPIFNKFEPLEEGETLERITSLLTRCGFSSNGVFVIDGSKRSSHGNAYFSGFGRNKRIVFFDTLLKMLNNDELEPVLAHELGHYKHKHIVKNIIISTAFSFLTFFLIAVFYDISLSWFEFTSRIEIAALPLLSVWAMIIGFVLTPVSNIISRKFEYQADEYAVKTTLKPDDFSRTLNRLNEQNMGDEDPHPIVEWFFYKYRIMTCFRC